jgi:hypothetical protein
MLERNGYVSHVGVIPTFVLVNFWALPTNQPDIRHKNL